ncbi:MAG TPA: class II fructose-bisphosphate aldolase [Nitrospirota bacterium]
MARTLQELMPANARKKLGSASKLCVLSSHDVFRVLKDDRVIIMACNTRIKHVIPAIMRAAQDLDAVVCFELAKSEGNLKGGYTGMTPAIYADTVFAYAEEVKFTKPFFIHGDHVTTKSPDPSVVGESRDLVKAELEAGYTSIAIDASFNETLDNIKVSSELGRMVLDAGAGLEAEVGEIKSTKEGGEITTVEEAVEFIEGMEKNKVHADLLATNNGSKHGNYKPGEEVHIELKRTGDIYNAIKKWGVCIAQHGITGTPLDLVGQFADYGIRKGNVGTNWQNIAHDGLPADLMEKMRAWAKAENKDIKFATKQFLSDINSIPRENVKKVEDMAYKSASEFITAFRARGTASLVEKRLLGK